MTNTDHTGKGPDEDKGKTRRRAMWAYRTYNRASSGWDWGNWLISFFQSKVATAIAVGTVGTAVSVGAVAVLRPELLQGWITQKPKVAVETQQWADSSIVYQVDGFDLAGRKASFDVLALTRDYTWVRGSSEQLQKNGTPLTELDLQDQIFRREVIDGLSRSADVIGVGVASQEGEAATEAVRADRRARRSAQWLEVMVPPTSSIWQLSLGQYLSTCPLQTEEGDTSWQRPFILIGVRAKQRDVVLSEALGNAFTGKTNLPSPDCYSGFNLISYR